MVPHAANAPLTHAPFPLQTPQLYGSNVPGGGLPPLGSGSSPKLRGAATMASTKKVEAKIIDADENRPRSLLIVALPDRRSGTARRGPPPASGSFSRDHGGPEAEFDRAATGAVGPEFSGPGQRPGIRVRWNAERNGDDSRGARFDGQRHGGRGDAGTIGGSANKADRLVRVVGHVGGGLQGLARRTRAEVKVLRSVHGFAAKLGYGGGHRAKRQRARECPNAHKRSRTGERAEGGLGETLQFHTIQRRAEQQESDKHHKVDTEGGPGTGGDHPEAAAGADPLKAEAAADEREQCEADDGSDPSRGTSYAGDQPASQTEFPKNGSQLDNRSRQATNRRQCRNACPINLKPGRDQQQGPDDRQSHARPGDPVTR